MNVAYLKRHTYDDKGDTHSTESPLVVTKVAIGHTKGVSSYYYYRSIGATSTPLHNYYYRRNWIRVSESR